MNPDTLSSEVLTELEKLRDIRLPDPVGWWPVAPAWWGLLALCLIILVAFAFLDKRRRASLQFAALSELKGLEARAKTQGDESAIAVDLAVLLRRVALSKPQIRHFASLSDTDWINTLMRGDDAFSPVVANYLGHAPYIPANEASHEHLGAALEQSDRWIRSHA
jgi:hypothetical protein